jgi:hypothetical protein
MIIMLYTSGIIFFPLPTSTPLKIQSRYTYLLVIQGITAVVDEGAENML